MAPAVWAEAYVLLDLRYSSALSAQLSRVIVSMKESSTYQTIVEEGRTVGLAPGVVADARKVLRLLGDDAFGPPDARTAAIERPDDLAQLERLPKRVRTADGWQELLGRATPGRRGGRRPS